MKPTTGPLALIFDLLLDGVLALALLFAQVNAEAPPQDLPWKPLRLDQPIGLATEFKLDRVTASPGRCLAFLEANGDRFAQIRSPVPAGPCTIPTPLRLDDDLLAPRAPLMDCPLAAAYALWVRQGVQAEAERLLHADVRAVEHAGTYACRGVRTTVTAPVALDPSEHAHALAIDIIGFDLSGGGDVSIGRDWRRADPKGQFLRAVRQSSCRVFHATLSPDYNAVHATHLHLDMGRFRLCS